MMTKKNTLTEISVENSDMDFRQNKSKHLLDTHSRKSKLENVKEFIKYYKLNIFITLLFITCVICILKSYSIIYNGKNNIHSNLVVKSVDEDFDNTNITESRKKRDIQNTNCSEEELEKCEKFFKSMFQSADGFPAQFRNKNNLKQLNRCIECDSKETITSTTTTSKPSYGKMFKQLKSLLHNEDESTNSTTENLFALNSTENNEAENSTEKIVAILAQSSGRNSSGNNEEEGTTDGVGITVSSSAPVDNASDVNSEGQSDVTEISSLTKLSWYDNTVERTKSQNSQESRYSNSESTNDYESSGTQNQTEPSKLIAAIQNGRNQSPQQPCILLNGIIQRDQNNEPDFNSLFAQTQDTRMSSTNKARENSSSNTVYQIPLLCKYYDQGFPPLDRISTSNSDKTSFRTNNNAWGFPIITNIGNTLNCSNKEYICADKSRCVLKSKWCDGKVNCPDASDETKCNCKNRIPPSRLCDGYFDCPLGEDELGCHGCDSNAFRCDDFIGRKSDCVLITQRCDDIKQCSNGRDEEDCSILSNDDKVTNVGYIDGFLHRNYKGEWYPVREINDTWIMDACKLDTGFYPDSSPATEKKANPNSAESCINIHKNGSLEITSDCNELIYVKCQELQCGTRLIGYLEGKEGRFQQRPLYINNNDTNTSIVNEKNDFVGIVGGRASLPKAWPFLAMILKDGRLLCGGTIINEKWILSAAHCFEHTNAHSYHEVRVGVLRRSSYSPTTQIRRAKAIFIHPKFNESSYQNDIALVLLSDEIKFNRWVRPACIPNVKNNTFVNGPQLGTECTVIGWGNVAEKGHEADNVREVSVPIMECIHDMDKNEGSVCAGSTAGGKDACNGDSGGPLMCQSPENRNRWYVGGVVSHGIGCAQPNELGVYSRVKTFSDWIEKTMENPINLNNSISDLKECSGFVCTNPPGQCLLEEERCNKIVDCLDAEDEINCSDIEQLNVGKNAVDHKTELATQEEIDDKFDNRIHDSEKSHQQNSDKPYNYSQNTIENNENKQSKNESSIINNEDEFNNETSVFPVIDSSIKTTSITNEISTYETDMSLNTNSAITETSSTGPSSFRLEQNFLCKKIRQTVSLTERCNGEFDCEDGTDEEDCDCKEILRKRNPEFVCNGRYDCKDMTDEDSSCGDCTDKGFKCIKSGDCIPLEQRCDGVDDCAHGEDETNCIALTNGQNIHVDIDQLPHLQHSGILTENENGKWVPSCISENVQNNITGISAICRNLCEYIGFSNIKDYHMVDIKRKEILPMISNVNNINSNYSMENLRTKKESENSCTGIHITCEDTLKTPSIDVITYPVPWQAAIYVEGHFRCTAIILDRNWLLSAYDCLQNLDVQSNHTVAVLGLSPTYKVVDGPYQQIIPVDSLSVVNTAEAIVLHLKNALNETRYVQPIFSNKKIFPPIKHEQCILLADSTESETQKLILNSAADDCPQCSRCFFTANNFSDNSLNSTDSTFWSGTVSCLGVGGWYPAAVFNNMKLENFNQQQAFKSIEFLTAHIFQAMDEYQVTESKSICNGVRCPLGNCVPMNKVCNDIQDCRDGSDELVEYCKEATIFRKSNPAGLDCGHTELRCGNGKCVPKSVFCDANNDCGDFSDEPDKCNCASYLKLTEPLRLCDGKRDCYDKSDEDPVICNCTSEPYCLGVNNKSICVEDYICDGEDDCLDRSDEAVCLTFAPINSTKPNVGRVMKKSFGVKHSLCLEQPVTQQTAIQYCKKFDYQTGNLIEYNEIDFPPTEIKMDDFYIITLNDDIEISLRKNKPLIELVPPSGTCYQVFLECRLQ